MKKTYHNIRNEYKRGASDLAGNTDSPFSLFNQWISEAISEQIRDYNAMTLSSSGQDRKVHSRIVLLREVSDEGIIFYSNFESNKSREIEENNHVSLLFFWADLEKQIRVEGKIKQVEADKSDSYFESRPRESQIASRISEQSKPLISREELIKRYSNELKRWEGKSVPRPENWGGYIVIPEMWEFWQGQPARLNHRLLYIKKGHNWELSQLQP